MSKLLLEEIARSDEYKAQLAEAKAEMEGSKYLVQIAVMVLNARSRETNSTGKLTIQLSGGGEDVERFNKLEAELLCGPLPGQPDIFTRAEAAEAQRDELEVQLDAALLRPREILDWLYDEADHGTAFECECGYSTYHSSGNECADCGAPFDTIAMLAFKLHASVTDRARLIMEVADKATAAANDMTFPEVLPETACCHRRFGEALVEAVSALAATRQDAPKPVAEEK